MSRCRIVLIDFARCLRCVSRCWSVSLFLSLSSRKGLNGEGMLGGGVAVSMFRTSRANSVKRLFMLLKISACFMMACLRIISPEAVIL